MSYDFSTFLFDKGILYQKSCPHTPQQNGVAERKNRHVLETVRTLLLASLVPPNFWCDAAQTAVYLLNRHPSFVLGKTTPYEALFGHAPSYSHLRVFGCLCFVHLPPTERTKLSPQAAKCIFLGYNTEREGFLYYDQSKKSIRISRNVVFLEHIPFFSLHLDNHPVAASYLPHFPTTTSPPPLTNVYVRRNTVPPMGPPSPDPLPMQPTAPSGINTSSTDSVIPLRRSSRPSVAPDRYGFSALFTSLDIAPIPTSYSQALKIAYWQDPMTEKLLALEANKTWEFVQTATKAFVNCDWQQMDLLCKS